MYVTHTSIFQGFEKCNTSTYLKSKILGGKNKIAPAVLEYIWLVILALNAENTIFPPRKYISLWPVTKQHIFNIITFCSTVNNFIAAINIFSFYWGLKIMPVCVIFCKAVQCLTFRDTLIYRCYLHNIVYFNDIHKICIWPKLNTKYVPFQTNNHLWMQYANTVKLFYAKGQFEWFSFL